MPKQIHANAVLDMMDAFPVNYDLLNMILGDVLGNGISRRVHAVDPQLGVYRDCVVKLEIGKGFQNVQEWEIWQDLANSDNENSRNLNQWFAPCYAISPCGQALIQQRTQPIQDMNELPTKIPVLFSDVKDENWGHYDGRVVCHDYGMNLSNSQLQNRLKKAVWR